MKNALIFLIGGLAFIFSIVPSIAGELGSTDIHGFISQGYLSSTTNDFSEDSKDTSFVYSEVGLNFGKDLTDDLRLGLQLFAKEFADLSNNEIVFDWAYADYRFHEMLGMRFGMIKFPHGLYNEIRDIDMLRTSVFLPDGVYREASYDLYVDDVFLSLQGISSRDLYLSLQGTGLYGYIDLGAVGGFSYQMMYGTQNIESSSDNSNRQLDYLSKITPFISVWNEGNFIGSTELQVDYKYAGNLLWDTPLEGLRLGASLDNLKMSVSSKVSKDLAADLNGFEMPLLNKGDSVNIDYNKIENWVYSVEYTWNNLLLMAEYLRTNKEYEIAIDASESNLLIEGAETDSTSKGWYVGGAYRFADWFELGGYYSESRYEDDKSITNFSVNFFTEFDDICATARVDMNEFWTLKLEVHNFRSSYMTFNSFLDAMQKKNITVEDRWYMGTAKMTVSF